MNGNRFERHLKNYNCKCIRHGAKHDILENNANGQNSSDSRHNELKNFLCYKICKDKGIPRP